MANDLKSMKAYNLPILGELLESALRKYRLKVGWVVTQHRGQAWFRGIFGSRPNLQQMVVRRSLVASNQATPHFLPCFLVLIICCSFSVMLHATTWVLPVTGDVIGEIQYATSEPSETIDEIGKRFSMGFYELARAILKLIQPTR